MLIPLLIQFDGHQYNLDFNWDKKTGIDSFYSLRTLITDILKDNPSFKPFTSYTFSFSLSNHFFPTEISNSTQLNSFFSLYCSPIFVDNTSSSIHQQSFQVHVLIQEKIEPSSSTLFSNSSSTLSKISSKPKSYYYSFSTPDTSELRSLFKDLSLSDSSTSNPILSLSSLSLSPSASSTSSPIPSLPPPSSPSLNDSMQLESILSSASLDKLDFASRALALRRGRKMKRYHPYNSIPNFRTKRDGDREEIEGDEGDNGLDGKVVGELGEKREEVRRGELVEKGWRIKNVGKGVWGERGMKVKLQWVGGEKVAMKEEVELRGEVGEGGEVEVVVGVKIPDSGLPCMVVTAWQLCNERGEYFGDKIYCRFWIKD
eukprot:TRINITY_DN8019_c0_g1_i1.p1 TRINITY_DN8019_c0_g1~~TRINITY_DN8019_c0_g1_i1.p1  ORF type:complete len:372 (-),score=121.89 TRINITY_DN8019_c0_g1_i1:43-1158(-)